MAILFTPPQCSRTFSSPVFNNHVAGETIPSPHSLKLKTSSAESWCSRFRSKSLSLVFSGALALGLSLSGSFHTIILPSQKKKKQSLNFSFCLQALELQKQLKWELTNQNCSQKSSLLS